MIFIDNPYVYRYVKSRNIKISHKKLVDYLTFNAVDKYSLERVTIYGSIDRSTSPEKIRTQENFYRMLGRLPKFDVQLFDLKVYHDSKGEFVSKKEKCVDCALVTGLVKYAIRGTFDTAIVVAGDEDFIPAVREVIDQGLEVIIAAFDGACAEKLIYHALGYLSLTDNLNAFTENGNNSNPTYVSPLDCAIAPRYWCP